MGKIKRRHARKTKEKQKKKNKLNKKQRRQLKKLKKKQKCQCQQRFCNWIRRHPPGFCIKLEPEWIKKYLCMRNSSRKKKTDEFRPWMLNKKYWGKWVLVIEIGTNIIKGVLKFSDCGQVTKRKFNKKKTHKIPKKNEYVAKCYSNNKLNYLWKLDTKCCDNRHILGTKIIWNNSQNKQKGWGWSKMQNDEFECIHNHCFNL